MFRNIANYDKDQLRSIIDSLPVSVCILDKKGNIENANELWFDLSKEFYFDKQKLNCGLSYFDYLNELCGIDNETKTKLREGINILIKKEKNNFELTYPLYTLNNKEHWFTVRANYYPDDHKVILIYEEVTEKKQLENKYESSIKKLQERIKEFECLNKISNVTARDDYTLEELFDYIVNMLPSYWHYPENVCARIILEDKKFQTSFFRETKWKLSSEIIVNDKKVGSLDIFYIEESVQYNKDPFLAEEKELIKSISKMLSNFVIRKKYKKELTESREYLQTTMMSVGDGIISTDTSGVVININQQAERITGSANEASIGRPIDEILLLNNDDDDRESISNYVNKAIKTGEKVFLSEISILRKDRQQAQIDLSIIPVCNDKNDITGIVITFSDITEQKMAKDELKKNEKGLEKLVGLFQKALSIQELQDFALEEAVNLTGSKLGHYYEYDERNKEFKLISFTKNVMKNCDVKEFDKSIKLEDAGIWAETVRQRIPVVINDYEAPYLLKKGYPNGHAKIRRYMGVPIIRGNKIVAVIGVANKENFYTQNDVLQLTLFMDKVWEVLKRKQAEKELKYIGSKDKLTKLYNRSYIDEKLQTLNQTEYLPLSIIIIDINGLKIINDTYGHSKGDELLLKTAEVIKKISRNKDITGRWGGDELIILMPNTDMYMAEDISKKIKNESSEIFLDSIKLKISLGRATKEDVHEPYEQFVKRAEDRLNKNKLGESESSKSDIISALLMTLKEKSDETEAHAWRMTKLCFKFGEYLGLSNSELDSLSLLATIHDIGKVAIAEDILKKPAKLTQKEWEKIKEHPEIGRRIASSSVDLNHIAEEIATHHERWDGKGYPYGLKGEEIPLLSRIIAIVDTFDVMTNKRSYKEAVSQEEALNEIKRCAGSQFDPELARKFIEVIKTSK
ncbi:HD domain-containing phosphohydrolase [Natranaerofaba carboxydovora]|uniref:HD domain-containing phosphohydrolase n=1 Tax=Natranaerofaba carboxydovora TaxID=2742683 RepID=UPI001F143567|nr:HD domain-containing phosphohydrolase [Natranaerofaba carboxydovora]UMZ73498.1 3'3'-cGAMP-specific phosphodiesterase 2 [Natranaerofaba carboxydovora]